MSKTVLVSGGAGYIGSHTCKALSKKGYLPIVIDNLSHGFAKNVRWGEFCKADIRDTEPVTLLVKKHRPIAAIHFAAFIEAGESVKNPEKYYSNNTIGSLVFFETLRSLGIRHVVFSSTCATYGDPKYLPLDEAHSQHPVNPYGMSKLMVERVLEDYDRAYGFKSSILRYFNAAGADPDGELGEEHTPETHLIPLALQAQLSSTQPLTIFGTDYETPDGTCVRDYVHVSDLADAHVLALERLIQSNTSEAYNLGNEKGNSVKEVLSVVETVTQKKAHFKLGPKRPGDTPLLVANAAKARKVLGWKPQFTDLHSIIQTAWNWQRREISRTVPAHPTLAEGLKAD